MPVVPNARSPRGFTLIELMVTIAMVAVLLMLAAPSFISFQRNSELTSTANSLLATMTAARAESMKAGRNAYVVPASGQDWTTGWFGYVDLDSSGTLSSGDTKFGEQPAMPDSIALVITAASTGFADGAENYVRFSGSGYPTLKSGGFGGGALELTNGIESRRIVMNTVGRMRVCKTSDTTCSSTGF